MKINDALEYIKGFIWNFKDYDNIERNLYGLNELIATKDCYKRKWFFNKLVVIVSISIIEALLIDLIYRLKDGTNHFPAKLKVKQNIIKQNIRSKLCNKDNSLKNLSLSKTIDFLAENQILELLDFEPNLLNDLNRLRNRIHIKNYYKNHHSDENITFNEKTVKISFNSMKKLIREMGEKLQRPW